MQQSIHCSLLLQHRDMKFEFLGPPYIREGKIAEFVSEQSCLAQFDPSTMKTFNSVSELSKLAQLHPIADVARHVGSPCHCLVSLGF